MNNRYKIYKTGKIWDCEKNKYLKNHKTPLGYIQVFMDRKRKYLHCIVAQKYLGVKPFGCEVNHKDGNKENNDIKNLEYVTRQENIRQMVKSIKPHPRGHVLSAVGGYYARMDVAGQFCYLGHYPNKEMAQGAYQMFYYLVYGEMPW